MIKKKYCNYFIEIIVGLYYTNMSTIEFNSKFSITCCALTRARCRGDPSRTG